MADRTRLELATSGVTGRHSNQLNYRSAVVDSRSDWWVMTGSNRRPSACKADALPAELITPDSETAHYRELGWAVKHLQAISATFSGDLTAPCFGSKMRRRWTFTRNFISRRRTAYRMCRRIISAPVCTDTPSTFASA